MRRPQPVITKPFSFPGFLHEGLVYITLLHPVYAAILCLTVAVALCMFDPAHCVHHVLVHEYRPIFVIVKCQVGQKNPSVNIVACCLAFTKHRLFYSM